MCLCTCPPPTTPTGGWPVSQGELSQRGVKSDLIRSACEEYDEEEACRRAAARKRSLSDEKLKAYLLRQVRGAALADHAPPVCPCTSLQPRCAHLPPRDLQRFPLSMVNAAVKARAPA